MPAARKRPLAHLASAPPCSCVCLRKRESGGDGLAPTSPRAADSPQFAALHGRGSRTDILISSLLSLLSSRGAASLRPLLPRSARCYTTLLDHVPTKRAAFEDLPRIFCFPSQAFSLSFLLSSSTLGTDRQCIRQAGLFLGRLPLKFSNLTRSWQCARARDRASEESERENDRGTVRK